MTPTTSKTWLTSPPSRAAARSTVVTRRYGSFGVWRALASAPAMVGSLLLLLVLLAGLGRWEGLLLLGWLGSGAMLLRPAGERLAVRVACGFRRPTADQEALLSHVWTAALQRAGTSAGDVDLYVRHRDEPNAYAAGGRSVAVTSGVLADFLARRLGQEPMIALLVHELGHRATKATQLGLMSAWLAAPWRLTVRLMTGIAMTLTGARRQPRLLLAVVAVAEVIVAVAQAAMQQQWLVAFLIGGITTAAVLCPLIDTAVSRRSEYAADRFAAQQGVGPDLADALRVLDRGASHRRSPMARLLASHPSTSRRLKALTAYSGQGCNVRGPLQDQVWSQGPPWNEA
jgi:STE24 endopeptidase